MSLVAWVSGNLLRHPFFSVFHRPPETLDFHGARGSFVAERPLTKRAAYLFLGLLALAQGEETLLIPRYQLLKGLSLKLYNQDLSQLLGRLGRLRLSFHGCFYEQRAFKTKLKLPVVEEIQEEGSQIRLKFARWVQKDAYAVDVALFRRLSPLAMRFYLYFLFALSRGSFRLSLEHLRELVPVRTKRQEAFFAHEWSPALKSLEEAGVLSFQPLNQGLILVQPGQGLQALRQVRSRRSRPAAISSANILLLGREHSGKTSRLRYFRDHSPRLFGLESLYLPGLYSVTDWLQLNFSAAELKGKSMVEKRRLLRETAACRAVLIDDLDRVSTQKLQLLKDCLRKAPVFVASARTYASIPESLRLALEKKGFREEVLKSKATRDLTFVLLALVVLVAASLGHHEWLLALLAARFLLRQNP